MKPLIPYFEPIHITLFEGFVLHGFGILVAHGLVFGTFLALRKIHRDGLDARHLFQLVSLVVLGVFLGGHVGLAIVYFPETVLYNPFSLFHVWNGIYSFGGFVTSATLAILYFRYVNRKRRKSMDTEQAPISTWGYADAILYGFTLGWFLGRMGCFSVHDHPGVETAFWLGVYGICPGGNRNVACHDLGLYEALWALMMLGVFMVLDRKPRFPGLFVGLAVLTYGLTRFSIDFLRHHATDLFYFGLTPAQYASVGLVCLGCWVLATRRHLPPIRPLGILR